MSAKVEAWVWDQKLAGNRKLILVRLAGWCNDEGVLTEPQTQEKLAHDVGMSRQTVNAHLASMRGEGLLQQIEHRDANGHRSPSTYRIMVPWAPHIAHVVDPDVGVKNPNVGSASSPASPSSSPSTPPLTTTPSTPTSGVNPAAGAADAPTHLSGSRWRVPSPRRTNGFIVDLAARTCTCENRAGTECRHLRVAGEAASLAETQADVSRRREFRDALWEMLIELFGPVSKRQESARGAAVTEMAEILTAEHVTASPDVWASEVRRRHKALGMDWTAGLLTMSAFVKNFGMAGKLADGAGASTNGKGSKGMTAQDMFDDAMRDQAAGL